MSELTQFFLAQSVIIIGTVFAAWVATKVQIAKLEVKVESLQADHAGLAKKMHGMSRHLAELTGKLHNCPHLIPGGNDG